MSIEALQSYTYVSKYARYRPELNRRETWEESVDRVIDMHQRKYPDANISEDLEFVRSAMKDKLVLGSQRALQFGGDPVLKKNARIYNCTTSYCDRPRFFQECLWLLLCGCGTGFSVQTHHIAKLPAMVSPNTGAEPTTFTIPDTIEGWADSLGVLLASYGITAPEFKAWVGLNVKFDASQIRPKGAPLSSSSGKAPGPEPLMNALEKIREVLDARLSMQATSDPIKLRPIDCYDVVMHASDAVLAGGVRRSATICLFSVDDDEMMAAKTGDWFIKNPQRGRSNNSALLLRDKTSWETFAKIMESVKQFGEPGFVWADSTEIMFNPCVEIGLYPTVSLRDLLSIHREKRIKDYKPSGDPTQKVDYSDDSIPVIDIEGAGADLSQGMDSMLSGWAFCNLCEINMKACVDVATWSRACKAAAILGTLQAGYATFAYLGQVSEAIAMREALLGCSMTGMMDNPKLAFDPECQRAMAKLILGVNAEFAPKIGVRPTARATCVKPAGTTSCILGTSSGIHAHHAKRYFRRSQGNDMEGPLQYFAAHNPRHVENSVWSANKTDKSVIFCIEVDDEALTKDTVSALELLDYVKLTQENWVGSGRNLERCAAPFLSHNVSNTINIKPDEWDAVAHKIYDNRSYYAGISLLSHSGDKDYPQAPFCEVLTLEQIVATYGEGALLASGLIVDGQHAFSNNLWAASDCTMGIGEKLFPEELRASIKADFDSGRAKVWQEEGLTPTSPDRLLNAWLAQSTLNLGPKRDWVRRAKQFATRYCHGNLRLMTYMLKDVSNYKLWLDLTREYQPIDWSLFFEDSDQTEDVKLDAACAGGKCELPAVK